MSEIYFKDMDTTEGLLKVDLDENSNLKLSMFLQELNNINIMSIPKNHSSIITNLIEEEPEDSYPKCFKNQFVKAGGGGFKRAYDKKC